MSELSLVIRNGTVVDGSGGPGYRADVGVSGDRIVEIGLDLGKADAEVDAEGHVVSPGFIDGHTHLDAQVFWDPMGTPSCWQGVTTAIVGNCGFTLAPARADARELVLRNLERAEDIPKEALEQGVEWSWERFSGYLDALDRRPLGINFGAYIGHSALRTWVMGERAFDEEATAEDLVAMEEELRDALQAGALGFSTSRSNNHMTADGRPVASRIATWDEVVALVMAMGDEGGGVFEISNESVLSSPDPDARSEYTDRLHALAVASGVPITFGLTSFGDPQRFIDLLDLLDRAAADGGRIVGQSTGRESSALFSFKTWLPFDRLPEWQELRAMSLEGQERALRDPDTKARLVSAAAEASYALGAAPARPPDYDAIRVLRHMVLPNESVATVAARRGVHPAEAMIDLALESDLDQFFMQISGNANPQEVQRILEHPHTVMTFSDAGAHVSQLINASLQTHLLALWVRERRVFTLERGVQMITSVPASVWNLSDRGLVREGFVADLNVFDPATIAPELPTVVADLPGGGTRLTQNSRGILATIVGGEVVVSSGTHTGRLPGRLLRRASKA